ncbi:hypothetical protein VP01_983g3 [Puccinia sorghi]|uniref:Uncharacterized protein n=1 Tax=Puccinia sorghi TaxID=27349 RepID=A0A0L6U5L9_9BASI|nr:hypothetical protein VP01_983g3 [Puccinia sorghi]
MPLKKSTELNYAKKYYFLYFRTLKLYSEEEWRNLKSQPPLDIIKRRNWRERLEKEKKNVKRSNESIGRWINASLKLHCDLSDSGCFWPEESKFSLSSISKVGVIQIEYFFNLKIELENNPILELGNIRNKTKLHHTSCIVHGFLNRLTVSKADRKLLIIEDTRSSSFQLTIIHFFASVEFLSLGMISSSMISHEIFSLIPKYKQKILLVLFIPFALSLSKNSSLPFFPFLVPSYLSHKVKVSTASMDTIFYDWNGCFGVVSNDIGINKEEWKKKNKIIKHLIINFPEGPVGQEELDTFGQRNWGLLDRGGFDPSRRERVEISEKLKVEGGIQNMLISGLNCMKLSANNYGGKRSCLNINSGISGKAQIRLESAFVAWVAWLRPSCLLQARLVCPACCGWLKPLQLSLGLHNGLGYLDVLFLIM